MKKGFIFNWDGTKLVNIAHIITISLEEPCMAQTDWTIVANLTHGTEILFKGAEAECHDEYANIYYNNL